jgi:hypothetical protein
MSPADVQNPHELSAQFVVAQRWEKARAKAQMFERRGA